MKTRPQKKDDREDFQLKSLCVETAEPPPCKSLIARPATSVGMFLRFSIIFEWWCFSCCLSVFFFRVPPPPFPLHDNPSYSRHFILISRKTHTRIQPQRFLYTKLMKYYALHFYQQTNPNRTKTMIEFNLNDSVWL